jgi:serine phosphatase RsbU (regulator of sigma subunit)
LGARAGGAHRRRRLEIEAEYQQRAKEMEEARQLQLSMLPQGVPYLPHVEVAACMKPATEVGGDYYDWRLGADGTLTVAIGDATGHGLKAGTMVTVTKGLFNHLAEQADLVDTLSQTSRALKRMNLRSLFMAMTLVRLKGYHLQCGGRNVRLRPQQGVVAGQCASRAAGRHRPLAANGRRLGGRQSRGR